MYKELADACILAINAFKFMLNAKKKLHHFLNDAGSFIIFIMILF